tara:strand:- start:681 stop:1703 length:1023 start_codon:yes stop_codon:yes gene_type:complete
MAKLEDIPPTIYPEGSVIGDFDAGTIPPEDPELLHRPHAFALMHGDGGAKVAYGELHWRVDVLKFKFETSTIAVNAHSDHSHSSHTTTNHQHTTGSHTHNIAEDTHDGHTHSDTATASYGKEGSGGNTGDIYTSAADSSGTAAQGSAYTHKHGGFTTGQSSSNTGSAGSETLTHSGVKDASDPSSSAPSGVLNHTVTGQITYCAQVGQESVGKINQQVPKVDAEDGDFMDAIIPNIYHQLSSYGDVYLCWKADLEQGAGSEVTHCWVQVGEPANDDIDEVPLGNSTTNRRNASGDDGITGANDNGIYSIKLGTVNDGGQITQKVSSDVVWSPTVIDRIGA